MSADDRFNRHAKLVSKMADKVGVDLTEEMQRGKVDAEDLRNMVHRCEGCTSPEDCIALMESEDKSAFPPSYCRNADAFTSMKS